MPMIFLESGLHVFPEMLRRRLQTEIDGVGKDVTHILIGFGFCGNALVGLHSADKILVVPKVDDCVTLLLGSMTRRIEINRDGAYFLTRGWLDNGVTLWDEYQRYLRQYGEKKTTIIMQSMIGHYQRLVLINTGLPEGGDWRETADRMAAAFSLEKVEIKGTYALIEKLLSGVWDQDMIVVQPGREIELSMLVEG